MTELTPIKVVAIHGFRIMDRGKQTVDKIAPFVEGVGWEIDIDEADYGFLNLLNIILFKGKARSHVINRLVNAIKDADVIYAHSNGVNYGIQALNKLPKEYADTKIVIWISGAANTRTPVPKAIKAMLVLYTPHDIWVRLSSYIPFNRWGRMGARGYLGDSNKCTNIMDTNVGSHSYWFVDVFKRRTWRYIYNFAVIYLK